MVVECWEFICRGILGMISINEDKMEADGKWGSTHILSGFEINVENMTIRPPTAKRCDALEKIREPMLNPGNRSITVKAIQEIRGSLITGDMQTNSGIMLHPH